MVYFIGAGPGDPKLLTVKGKEIIDRADVIIYAGSLVNKEVLSSCKAEAKIYNSAVMTLEEVIALMQEAESRGGDDCQSAYRRSVLVRCAPGADGQAERAGDFV